MKNKKRSRGGGDTACWSAAQHAARGELLGASKTARQAHRTAVLTHDTTEKRSAMKLKLHLTKIARQVTTLKKRLQTWDAVEEAQKAAAAAAEQPKKKKGRKGPETWKLRGAARPAHEVYDFDTRYVCPHLQAHEDHSKKVARLQNLLVVYRGQLDRLFADSSNSMAAAAANLVREYLGLLMQWGHLAVEAKQYKTARAAWLECMELEGTSNTNSIIITTAREDLVRLYVQLKRYPAVLRLGQDELANDTSVSIRFAVAWVAVQLEQQQDTTQDVVQKCMIQAIRSNPFCAYYLAFSETFSSVMEYTHEISEADDVPESSLEEALEYCTCEDIAASWQRNGAADVLRNLLLGALHQEEQQETSETQNSDDNSTVPRLTRKDIEWEERLNRIEEEYEARTTTAVVEQASLKSEDVSDRQQGGSSSSDDNDYQGSSKEYDDEESLSSPPDLKMFAGMFRTAMEMLEESGELDKRPLQYVNNNKDS